jgi:hypothetical protein
MMLADVKQGLAIPPKSLFATLMATVFRRAALKRVKKIMNAIEIQNLTKAYGARTAVDH